MDQEVVREKISIAIYVILESTLTCEYYFMKNNKVLWTSKRVYEPPQIHSRTTS